MNNAKMIKKNTENNKKKNSEVKNRKKAVQKKVKTKPNPFDYYPYSERY